MGLERGCYRCGRSLAVFAGGKRQCPTCGKRFCEPCMDAYKSDKRDACPKCNEPIQNFTIARSAENQE